ncbi:N-acetylglucosamine-induced protein 1 [Cyphellophora attinorum]|uniref:N-acetylglucosamine-induced protein 1 n=1 Tax=Cyphellophora attinorum TaxID=1664694 RepID=A0A0N1P1T3_9EURO|nr:N-acetylglucosamine-induced protein 1 [Phialophora attinorum]KPI41225.1 N-acetylglucosamine-induced protein 1 [Phialophora attinorum]
MPHSVHGTSGDEYLPISTATTAKHEVPPLANLYWNTNLTAEEYTLDCPPYLQNIALKARLALSTRDTDFHIQTWDEVREIVASNRIDKFQRMPSQLRAYLKYMWSLKKEHRTVMDHVKTHRLQWEDVMPLGKKPFEEATDWKVLYNDWPYGIDPEIVHLVVWTKFALEDDPITDDLTPRMRAFIERFVMETFCSEDGVERESLVWFKNWKSLKSIHALEHFHIMLHKPSPQFLRRITNDDRPTWTTV